MEKLPSGVREVEPTTAPGLFEGMVFIAELALTGVLGALIDFIRKDSK